MKGFRIGKWILVIALVFAAMAMAGGAALADEPDEGYKINFQGFSGVVVTLKNAGGKTYSSGSSGVNNSYTFKVPEGDYDLTVSKSGMVYKQEVTVVNGGSFDVPTSTLTVNFPGISAGFELRIGGKKVVGDHTTAELNSRSVKVFRSAENVFDISVKHGAAFYEASGIVCDDETEEFNVPIVKVTLPHSGRTSTARLSQIGGKDVYRTIGSRKNETDFYVLPGGTYDFRITINNKDYWYRGIAVGDDDIVLDKANAQINFPGVKNATVWLTGGGKTFTNAGGYYTNDGINFTNVPNGEYDLRVRTSGGMEHNAKVTVFADTVYDVPLTALTVNFPGVSGVNVKVMVGDKAALQNSNFAADSYSFIVFRGNDYGLVVAKNAMVHTVAAGIVSFSGETAEYSVPLTRLTVNFPGVSGVNVKVRVGGAAVMENSYYATDTYDFIVFKGITYDLRIAKNAMVHEGEILCDDAEEVYDVTVVKVTVNFPGLRSVNVKVYVHDGGYVTENLYYAADSTAFNLFACGPYDFVITSGNRQFRYDNIRACQDRVLDKSSAQINFPGVSSATVWLTGGGKTFTNAGGYYTSDGISFDDVPNGEYDLRVRTSGGMEHNAKVYVLGGFVYDVPLTRLTVNFPGVSGVNVKVMVGDKAALQNSSYATDSHSFIVFRGNDYGLVFTKNAMVHTVAAGTVSFSGETAEYNVPLTKLTVNFPGVSGVNVKVRVGGAAVMENSYYATDTYDFIVFRGITYDLRIAKNAMVHEGEILCDDAEEVYDVTVVKVTVNFPGLRSVNVKVYVSGGGYVTENSYYAADSTAFNLFACGPYDFVITSGSRQFRYDNISACQDRVLDKSSAQINFPGVSKVNVRLTGGGKTFSNSNYVADGISFDNVPNGEYDLSVRTSGGMEHNAKVYVLGGVVYNVPLTRLTVNFPGVSGVNVKVMVGDKAALQNSSYATDSHSFTVFRGNDYGLVFTKNAMVHTVAAGTVSFGGETAEYSVPLTRLTVNFPGVSGVNVKVRVGGAAVMENPSFATDTYDFIVFRGITYDLRLAKNGMIHEGNILCDEAEEVYNVPLTHLTIKFAGVKSVTVELYNSDGALILRSNNYMSDEADYTVFRDATYTIKLVKGGSALHEGSILCDEAEEIFDFFPPAPPAPQSQTCGFSLFGITVQITTVSSRITAVKISVSPVLSRLAGLLRLF